MTIMRSSRRAARLTYFAWVAWTTAGIARAVFCGVFR
jgi:hypothetical protein